MRRVQLLSQLGAHLLQRAGHRGLLLEALLPHDGELKRVYVRGARIQIASPIRQRRIFLGS